MGVISYMFRKHYVDCVAVSITGRQLAGAQHI